MSKIKNTLKKIGVVRYIYYKYNFSDKKFIKKYYKKRVGKEVNLKNPTEFSDKLQWLKLYWHNSSAKICADKYEVRNMVDKKIGSEFLNELYDVYNSVEEINLNKLPNSFILKATHSSGYNFVCKDKNAVDWKAQFKELRKWFKVNYFWNTREWVYKNIKPRIICERFLSEGEGETSLTDYKIYCFNGTPRYCQVIRDRGSEGSEGTIDFFDTEWNHMEFTGLQRLPHSTVTIQEPDRYGEMLELAKKLSQEFPFVRVDLYYVNGKIYFGELTFFPQSGFGTFDPPEWNRKIGDLIRLPDNPRLKV
ncbi:glycosyl transferase [Virgibacillus sp. NKC19-3]|uniref:ATP-grasp fold amidoligase family protein n=1 Tax=Virgibacillus saliphilus TaxID=2831674 RepID=UPI001C9AA8D0|nr:ATP-grasp fold amidoligase family protein [Virgibacillus sp. NKC19-3]MBY7144602.1 glycosyl transferase [Virgibacillus sp. NKC19-3]